MPVHELPNSILRMHPIQFSLWNLFPQYIPWFLLVELNRYPQIDPPGDKPVGYIPLVMLPILYLSGQLSESQFFEQMHNPLFEEYEWAANRYLAYMDLSEPPPGHIWVAHDDHFCLYDMQYSGGGVSAPMA